MRLTNYTFKRGAYMQDASINCLGLKLDISAGNSDDLYVYHNKDSIYVLSINYKLEYVGLQQFDRQGGGLIGEVFIQDAQDESFSWILESKRMPTVINFLSQYIY
jgi:hypothetical protein